MQSQHRQSWSFSTCRLRRAWTCKAHRRLATWPAKSRLKVSSFKPSKHVPRYAIDSATKVWTRNWEASIGSQVSRTQLKVFRKLSPTDEQLTSHASEAFDHVVPGSHYRRNPRRRSWEGIEPRAAFQRAAGDAVLADYLALHPGRVVAAFVSPIGDRRLGIVFLVAELYA